MEDEGHWVLLSRPTEIDYWSPTLMDDDEEDITRPLKILFSQPAKYWTDAAPIGNGRLGAMVWGGVASETLQLNEDTLWTGVPGNYTDTNAPPIVSQVRELVDKSQYVEATEAAYKLLGQPTEAYQPLGDIKLDFGDSHISYDPKSYERELDLDTATVKLKYSVGDVEFTREHFTSNPHQVMATKISASKSGSLSFTVSLDSKLNHLSRINADNQIIMEGNCPGTKIPPILINPKGVQFAAALNLEISDGAGVVQVLDNRTLRIEGSDWAVLLLVASSSFDGPFTKPADSEKDPTTESLNTLNSIRKMSFDDLYANHLVDYHTLFRRVSLQLSKNPKIAEVVEFLGEKRLAPSRCDLITEKVKDDIVSTAERVNSFKTDEDPSLVELLFQYGRYLLISSSRPGTQPSNLQGIWNQDVEPAWDCAPHLNINLQMNYWPALSCNLPECHDPLFDYLSYLSINGSKTACVNYEASGWVVHSISDIWGKTSVDRGNPKWAVWPMGGAWLCTHVWEHYTYTMDKEFLKNKAYPLLEGCTSFLLDWLIEGRGGFLETNPSTSPEHMFIAPEGKPASVSYSTTIDMAIIREVFLAILSAAEVLGRNEDTLVEKVRIALPKLYAPKIARDGSIMEWAEDFQDPEVTHRHLSHLFGLFPGHSVTVEKCPDLCKAATKSLYKRGDGGPGWSITWKALLWARLRSSENSYGMLKNLFNLVDPDQKTKSERGLYSNLFNAHPPFQIDGNFGFTAAIAEMLVQSTMKDLYLLPALPRDKWASGYVKGLQARGGMTVSICWQEGELHQVGVWSKDQNCVRRLHYNGTVATARVSCGFIYTFNKQLKCVKTEDTLLKRFC